MDAVLQNFRRSFGSTTPFFHSLSLDPPATMEELYRHANRYSTLEDKIRVATQTVMITNQPAEKDKLSRKKPSVSNKGQNKDRKRPRDQSQERREPPQFTPLNISYERLLPLIRNLLDFKWPMPIQAPTRFQIAYAYPGRPSQRNKSLRCDYHRDHGHKIDRCRSLKFLVENLIKARHVLRYLRDVEQGVELG